MPNTSVNTKNEYLRSFFNVHALSLSVVGRRREIRIPKSSAKACDRIPTLTDHAG